MFRAPIVLLALCLVLSGHANAQAPTQLRSGDQVRVRSAPASGEYTVLDRRGDVLTLQDTSEATVEVPLSAITRLHVHRGPRSPGAGAGRGAGIGFLIGAGLGAAAGLVQGDDQSGFIRFSAAEKGMFLGAAFGGIGAIVGAITGHASPGERWERLPDPGAVQVGPRAGGGWGVVLSRRF